MFWIHFEYLSVESVDIFSRMPCHCFDHVLSINSSNASGFASDRVVGCTSQVCTLRSTCVLSRRNWSSYYNCCVHLTWVITWFKLVNPRIFPARVKAVATFLMFLWNTCPFFVQWTLIAGRVKTILGLALNYYSIQRVLCDGVGASAVSARCQLEIERVEKQFDECMVFLMRVSQIQSDENLLHL